MDATGPCIILFEVDEVQVFAGRWCHALLLVESGGMKLLVWANSRDDAARLMGVVPLFVVVISRGRGERGGLNEFARDPRHVELDVMVNGGEVES